MDKSDVLIKQFHSDHYLNHNLKRLQHLDSLNIDFNNKSVLELGAGIGDHTDFLLSKNISEILVTDARKENLDYLNKKYQDNKRVEVAFLDMEMPLKLEKKYDIIYCYGLLYHLSNPEKAIVFMGEHCKYYLLLETSVSFGDNETINLCDENINNPSQAFSGKGCRPTRIWVNKQLKKYFRHIYMPITQPDHEEFPIDWLIKENHKAKHARSIFIASNIKLNNLLLTENIPYKQNRFC